MATIVVCNQGSEKTVQWKRQNAKSGRNIINALTSLLTWDGYKGRILWGGKCCSSWVLNLYLIIENIFRERRMQFLDDQWVVCLVFGWFVGGLAGLWVVCGWCGQFVGGLAGLWVVLMACGWFRVLQLTVKVQKEEKIEVPEKLS